MMPTMIRRVTVEDLTIALHEPFGIAGGAQDVARNLLVTIELADGTRGYGEAAPFTAFNGDTLAGARAALTQATAHIVGADVREWRAIAAALDDACQASGSARCALETAVLDALTRHLGLPLWAWFGGAGRQLITDMTITTGTAAAAHAAARAVTARGITTIKLKVGATPLADDLERVMAVRAAAPGAALILDGNGGMSADHALQLLALLHERSIVPVLFEQPVPTADLDGLRLVSRLGGVRIAADESASNVAAVFQIAATQAAHVVNIKLMKSGIVEALEMVAIARATGLGLMIGGMIESPLAMTTSACFAAGIGGFGFVDLDTPLFLAEEPLVGGMQYVGATIDLSAIVAGHGVVPRDAAADHRRAAR